MLYIYITDFIFVSFGRSTIQATLMAQTLNVNIFLFFLNKLLVARLPSLRLDRPRFVMTASCPSSVRVKEHFRVKYVLLNNLQDFLAVRLVWTPDGTVDKEQHSD